MPRRFQTDANPCLFQWHRRDQNIKLEEIPIASPYSSTKKVKSVYSITAENGSTSIISCAAPAPCRRGMKQQEEPQKDTERIQPHTQNAKQIKFQQATKRGTKATPNRTNDDAWFVTKAFNSTLVLHFESENSARASAAMKEVNPITV